jgi:NTE family protein
MAHIGVLEELDEAGVTVDCVAGTSAGAMVGGAYAADCLEGFRDTMCGLTRRRVWGLFDPVWPYSGLFHGRKPLELIRPYVGNRIEDLPHPYAAVATDLRSGEAVALRRGSVVDAIRASAAIPGLFMPEHREGRLLADGGIVNPLPVNVARGLGADFVIAVSVLGSGDDSSVWMLPDESHGWGGWLTRALARHPPEIGVNPSLLATNGYPGGNNGIEMRLLDVLSRATSLAQLQIAAARLHAHPPDCLITIALPQIGLFDFHRSAEAVTAGRIAARNALPALRRALTASNSSLPGRLSRWLTGSNGHALRA